MNLEQALKTSAYHVWNQLEPINNPAFKIFAQGEEGLTVDILRILAKSNSKSILSIQMIGKIEESRKGFDFAIVIGNKSKNKSVKYLIQAKKLVGYKLSSIYSHFEEVQLNTLRLYAKSNRSIPLYALYNYLDHNDNELRYCYSSVTKFDKAALGITLASVSKMNAEKAKLSFSKLHKRKHTYYRKPFYRYSPSELNFYNDNLQTAVPFHELAYFSLDYVEKINSKYRKQKAKGILPFFFFFGGFGEWLFNDGEELIPTNNFDTNQIIEQFYSSFEENPELSPKSLVILEVDN